LTCELRGSIITCMSAFQKSRTYYLILEIILCIAVLSKSVIPLSDPLERVRAFTRNIEFDYITWTIDAMQVKFGQGALDIDRYLTDEQKHDLVIDYIDLVIQIQTAESDLKDMYANPAIENPDHASTALRAELSGLYQQRELLGQMAETIIQSQLSQVIADEGLSFLGQSIPPILYRSSPLPLALIVSPRDVIRQDADISLLPDLTLEECIDLENRVEKNLDVSALVVEVGGIGVYPTMVMQTSDLNWLMETVAHEWIHNYLFLHPLGLNYSASPELRTMNETTASIAGKEIGRAVIARFYKELLPPPEEATESSVTQTEEGGKTYTFNFQHEMHLTRIIVDQLLAAGKVEQAEEFMEERRLFFWENGYPIRKINQAYFAFHGAYADEPMSAAGKDPVGAAVRELRAASPSLKAFVNEMAWMSSYEDLEQVVYQK